MKTLNELPTLEDFKQKATVLKKLKNIDKSTLALHELAKLYGYKNYNSIKPYLFEKNSKFNKLPKNIDYYTTADGAIVNAQGLYKTSTGYRTIADTTTSTIPKHEVKKALCFIDHVLVKRKTVNRKASSSYGLKHFAEDYLRHYNLFKDDKYGTYVSNAAMIVALDLRGFKIAHSEYDYSFSLNIGTNYSTKKEISNTTINNHQHNEEFYKAKVEECYLPIKEPIYLNENIKIDNYQSLSKNHIQFLNFLVVGKGENEQFYKFIFFDKKRTKDFFEPLIKEGIISHLSMHKSYGYSHKIYSNMGYFRSKYNLKNINSDETLFSKIDNIDVIEFIKTLD